MLKSFSIIPVAVPAIALLMSAQLYAEEPAFSIGQSSIDKPQHWQTYTDGMSDQQYRNAYRNNQRRISRFIKSYSENALLSAGIPETGIKVIGVAAGLAANRDATLYLNKNHILAVQFKDVVNDNRALFFGIKMDW